MADAFHMSSAGWHYDEDIGAFIRDVVHRMGRRCRNWDYCGTGVYQITITLADRRSCSLGRLRYDENRGAWVDLSEAGRMVEAVMAELARQWPGVEVLGLQVMPDHVHFVLAVKARQLKPLGAIVGSFKSRATSRWLQLCRTRQSATAACVSCAAARAPSLWAPGFVDTILFDDRALRHSLAYLADNPRRLWEKRARPELFSVLRDLPINLGDFTGHFAAIGNHNLLKSPSIFQVQCSRRFFSYARDTQGRLDKEAQPRVATAEFTEKCEALLEEAAHGAVLLSPCISEGEREIARRAFAAGHRVITLANKGFSPLYKPGGKLFDTCARGNLLMLAPVGWPYLPGEKKMTRMDACILNRLAQLISGPGAVEIRYDGLVPSQIDDLVRQVVESDHP